MRPITVYTAAMARARRGPETPSRLTPRLQASVVRLIKAGYCLRDVAAKVCVPEDALASWVSRGEAGERRFAAFARAVRQARAIDAIRTVAIIRKAALAGDWRAAAYLLIMHHGYGTPGEAADLVRDAARFEFYRPQRAKTRAADGGTSHTPH
jgi:hypothetical protein